MWLEFRAVIVLPDEWTEGPLPVPAQVSLNAFQLAAVKASQEECTSLWGQLPSPGVARQLGWLTLLQRNIFMPEEPYPLMAAQYIVNAEARADIVSLIRHSNNEANN